MSCFANDVALVGTKTPDPTRHVNYVQGMVLGVDDFTQEFAYLAGRDQWLARDLLGYGTVRGLAVDIEDDKAKASDSLQKWKVTVTSGAALDPCGRLICVPRDQCGYLNDWLKGHADAVGKKVTGVEGSLDLYLTLSYGDCPTDSVPIPGEPCRSESELKAPSRIADDFLLELSVDPPTQMEDEWLGKFMAWLGKVRVDAGSGVTPEDFAKKVGAWEPEAAEPPLVQPTSDWLRDALRVWATKLRPAAYGRSCGCATTTTSCHDERVLLARITLTVEQPSGQPWRVKALSKLDESARPVLIHLRMLAQQLHPLTPTTASATTPSEPTASQPVRVTVSTIRTVAAGKLRGDNVADGPVLGKLRIAGVEPGKITFTFDGYAKPADEHQYIVKVLALSHANVRAPVVRFLAYTDEGFVLRVNPNSKANSTVAILEQIEFILEVDEIRNTP
ncbi:MAG: hypothetical protein AW08_01524 [Candidatus Accumulibacter adjunctus]|uniref:Uncharacterized protein n=1 Tax=Candidatus Accumulibacter adjunctus TaxID=1454001 RepID=A0A011NTR3_9PROT|nr:MAG: hypothetical protein AW08_01524 [Candidatus Accumulibacter adjunctus]